MLRTTFPLSALLGAIKLHILCCTFVTCKSYPVIGYAGDGTLNLTMRIRLITCLSVLLLSLYAEATNYTVKAGGGGNYTTIQACANAMSAGDTCTVYAGTYNENVTVSAGTASNYKTIAVNGSDVVTVLGFTLNSHTKLVGNCAAPAAINTCGFNIQNPSSPGSTACISMPNGTTDVYIRNNVMYACGSTAMIAAGYPETVSYIYVQGNTLSYACITQAQAGTATKECDGILIEGNHVLVENNDLSHYTLGLYMNTVYGVFRNNTMHDQYETEAGGNSHTDAWFSEPGVSTWPVEYNVIEGNYLYNGFGVDAKGNLSQNESCGGNCYNLIQRFNTVSRIGGAVVTNNANPGWPYVKVYNNTYVDTLYDQIESDPINDNHTNNGGGTAGAPYASELNNIFYFTQTSGSVTVAVNPYAAVGTDVYGYNLAWCPACAKIFPHTYGSGSWTSDPGNKNANPLFVSYVSPGSLSNDYHLQAGSPAIAAGTSLTTVASGDSGSGTSLVVNDASYFQDSYGLSNDNSTVYADCISVTTVGNHVCITAVNYSTNTLTLASNITRSIGDKVWLYSKSDGVQVLTGTAPNIGAFGAGSTSPTGAAPPTGLAASVN
jgi:hypothetical protein